MHNSPSCTLYVTRKYRLAHVDMVLPFIYSWSSEERLLKSQVSSGLLQTAQTWANAGVCGGLCACAVGGTFD